MIYLKRFKLFEGYAEEYIEKIGNLLRLYGAIPITRWESGEVIIKIIDSIKVVENYDYSKDAIKSFPIDISTIPLNGQKSVITLNFDKLDPVNRLRFSHYFYVLMRNKTSRGFNFEGMLTGFLQNAELTETGAKSDLVINKNEGCNVKFSEKYGERIDLGSMQNATKYFIENKKPDDFPGIDSNLYNFFKNTTIGIEHKESLFDSLFSGITYFIFGYDGYGESNDDKNYYYDNYESVKIILVIDIISKEHLRDCICQSGDMYVTTSKSSGKYSFGISNKIREKSNYQLIFEVSVPTMEELNIMMKDDIQYKGKEIYGEKIIKKIRPDILSDLVDDENFNTFIKNYNEFKKRTQ